MTLQIARMIREPIPAEVRRFILISVASVPYLEAMLLMREEAEWFRSLEAATSLEERVAAANAHLAEAGAGQGGAREVLAAKIAEVEAERSAAAAQRDKAARALGRPLLSRYDRIRSGTSRGPVVVPLHGNACGACYTAVPMSGGANSALAKSLVQFLGSPAGKKLFVAAGIE